MGAHSGTHGTSSRLARYVENEAGSGCDSLLQRVSVAQGTKQIAATSTKVPTTGLGVI